MRITACTLNPCIDWTVTVPVLKSGGLNLVEETRKDVSGKGINVAIVLKELGLDAMCTGINFIGNGNILNNRLGELGIPYDFIMAPGELRTNIKILDQSRNRMTELNSRGNPVGGEYLDTFLAKLENLVPKSGIMVFSGRIPNGAGHDIYRRCLKICAKHSVKAILDAEGESLLEALAEKCYLVKPNTYELETFCGRRLGTREEIVSAAREMIRRGAEIVCVSMGEKGAIIADQSRAFYSPALDIQPKGFQGSGDSMVAGICKAIAENLDIPDMLRYGMACAAASIIREGTLLCKKEDYLRFLPKVNIKAAIEI